MLGHGISCKSTSSLETEYTAKPTNKPTAPDSFTHSGAGWLTKAHTAFRKMLAMARE